MPHPNVNVNVNVHIRVLLHGLSMCFVRVQISPSVSNSELFSILITFLIMAPIPVAERSKAVAQLVEALRNKPEGGGFDSRWSH